MKIFKIIFLLLFLPALISAQETTQEKQDKTPAKTEQEIKSDFYQKFVTAAWLENHGQYEQALVAYDELNTQSPNNLSILKPLCSLALEEQKDEILTKCMQELLNIAPRDSAVLVLYADYLLYKGELASSLKAYEDALSVRPEDMELIFKYVSILSNTDSEKAVVYLKKLSKEYPKVSSYIALQIANIYLKQNDTSGAVLELKAASTENPFSPEIYMGLIKIYENSGDADNALKEYLKMEKSGLADADILSKIGAYYVLKNDRETAQSYFLKAKNLDNAHAPAAQFLALYSQQQGQYQKALDYLKASRDFDKNPSFYVRISYYLNMLNRTQDALENMRVAHQKFPDNLEISYYLALALYDTKEYKEAAKIFEEILKISKSEPVLFNYAITLYELKEYKEMQSTLETLINLAPQNAVALNFLGYFLIDKDKDLKQGFELIERALKISPQDPAFQDSLAWYYYKIKNYDKALDILRPLTNVKDSEIYQHTGDVYFKLKNFEEAAKNYQLSLNLDPKNKTAQKGLKSANKKISK